MLHERASPSHVILQMTSLRISCFRGIYAEIALRNNIAGIFAYPEMNTFLHIFCISLKSFITQTLTCELERTEKKNRVRMKKCRKDIFSIYITEY